MKKLDIVNPEEISKDASFLVDHITSLTDDDKKWFYKVCFREVIRSKHYSLISEDKTQAKYVRSQELLDNARYIVDWLTGLQERDPKQHGKLSRITFQQSLKHSQKWHAELTKKAEQSDRYIEPNAENAPKVLDLGDGWEVFWLKTDEARDVEGEAMGHCIGNGVYDNLRKGEAVFSIRKNNVTHITLHMEKLRIKQAVTKGNGEVPERYQHLVDKTATIIGTKLFIEFSLEDRSSILDGWYKNSDHEKIHISNGLLNSINDRPAVINENGTKRWYKDGLLHKESGPAVINDNNSAQLWYQDGKLHRLDGPAVIRTSGDQFWYKDGKLHREDGPAVIWKDGTQEWYKDGKRHRDDGPAIIWEDGSWFWYKDDKCHREEQPAVAYTSGTQEWLKNGKLHRDDGPAVIYADGAQIWFNNGKLHREDGPAVIEADGTQIWYQNDKQHRDDGPAVIYADGTQEWWLKGNRHTEEEFNYNAAYINQDHVNVI